MNENTAMAGEADNRVQNEFAVRCTVVAKPACVLQYVKAISSLVGAAHILAVFEENDSIKVFFNDKRCVETLIKGCVHVMGLHVKMDYVVPPGVKLILSNVDPIITNLDITRLLSLYGTVVSPVIRPPISYDVELCHISSGIRHIYMILTNGYVPDKIEFRYGEHLTYIKVNVVDNSNRDTTAIAQRIKTDSLEEHPETEPEFAAESPDSVPGPSDSDTLFSQETNNPVLVSVQSVPAIEQPVVSSDRTPADVPVSGESSSPKSNESLVITRKRKVGRPVSNRKKMDVVSQAAKRIKNAKSKLRGYRKRKYKRRTVLCIAQNPPSEQPTDSVDAASMPDLVRIDQMDTSDEDVLSNQDLLNYIEEVKGHRAPLELARKYIGEGCDSDKINGLMTQLRKFKKKEEDMNLKARIWRLLRTLSDALRSEDQK